MRFTCILDNNHLYYAVWKAYLPWAPFLHRIKTEYLSHLQKADIEVAPESITRLQDCPLGQDATIQQKKHLHRLEPSHIEIKTEASKTPQTPTRHIEKKRQPVNPVASLYKIQETLSELWTCCNESLACLIAGVLCKVLDEAACQVNSLLLPL